MNYKETHVSRDDHSTAMLVFQGDFSITLVNEDGYQWTDPLGHWHSIEAGCDYRCEPDEDDTYTSGEQYMADYLNSDSNIAYLNGY